MSSENNVYAMPSAERRAARKASLPSMSGRLAVVRQMTWGEFKKQACQSSSGWRKTLGELGEEVVVELLERQGWRILERNWRAGRYAEIDLVALDSSGLLVFAEV
ncbi:MAG TPA: YraN family protein, partial [Chroococcales cyanobacterium]